jgi:gluconolactonase
VNNVPRVWIVILAFAFLSSVLSGDHARGEDVAVKKVKVGDVVLVVPNTWKQQPPSNRLRLAQFGIPASGDDKEPAELSVFNFGGGGAVAQQVDRWKGQFLPKDREFSMEQGKIELGAYVLVELSGTYKKSIGPPVLRKTTEMPGARMLVVMISTQKGNYFLKLVGLNATVSAAAADFRKSFGAPPKKSADTKKKTAAP